MTEKLELTHSILKDTGLKDSNFRTQTRCKRMKVIRKTEFNSYLQENMWREESDKDIFQRTFDLISL